MGARHHKGAGEGTIYKDSRGLFRAELFLGYDGAGKKLVWRKASKTRSIVAAALHDAIARRKDGQPLASSRETVATFLRSWLESVVRPNRAFKTYKSYEQVCRCYLIPELGNIELGKLAAQHVDRMLAKLAERGLADQTRLTARAVLRTALATASRKWKLIASNPAADSDAPGVEKHQFATLAAGDVGGELRWRKWRFSLAIRGTKNRGRARRARRGGGEDCDRR